MAGSDPCPSCSDSLESGHGECQRCHFPVAMLHRFREKFPGISVPSAPLLSDLAGLRKPITRNVKVDVSLQHEQSYLIGSGDHVSASGITSVKIGGHLEIGATHVAILCDQNLRVWVVALIDKREMLPLVDGTPCVASELTGGSVLQIGPYGWVYDANLRSLWPLEKITGSELPIDVEVTGRLLRTRLNFKKHELVAITGPSGCGKSTLIGEIGSGRVGGSLNGSDEKIYFVPQSDLMHDDLRIGDELEFVAKFYNKDEILPSQVDDALQSVGLTLEHANRFPSQLSGGQKKRCRIAAALLSGRGVIVLDEPDSGLDHETATEVIRVLRSISLRGATVIVVTHHRHVLEMFDRVIIMTKVDGDGGGKLVDDSAVPDLSTAGTETEGKSPTTKNDSHPRLGVMPQWKATHQVPRLTGREYRKCISARMFTIIPTFLFPLFVVPLFFAFLISISVPTDPGRIISEGKAGGDKQILVLGFLSLISIVWMSASQSHLAFARQRELYDHEQALGVRWACLLAAKAVANTIMAIIQASVFLAFLYLIRSCWLDRSFFVADIMCHKFKFIEIWLCFSAVATAATAIGLLISVVANRNTLMAAAWLPVLMMVQILFSAYFAVFKPEDNFTGDKMDCYRQLAWDFDNSLSESDVPAGKRPLCLTSRISYFTLTRYGDQWLRTFSADVTPVPGRESWRWKAIIGLLLSTAAYYSIALVVLCGQSGWRDFLRRIPRVGGVFRTARIGVLAIVGGFFVAGNVAGQNRADSTEIAPWREISLSLVDGRYDSNALRRQLGAHASATEQWRRLDGTDLLALSALQLAGHATFDLDGDTLHLRFAVPEFSKVVAHLAPCRLDVPNNLEGSKRAVLFVHGLEGGASTFSQARQQCREHGIVALSFDYPNDGPTKVAADALQKQLQDLSNQHPDLRLAIVAHSLGGLVTMWAVSNPDFPTALVTDVFTLGTPFRGSALAEFQSELELVDLVWHLGHAQLANPLHDGQGEAATDITPDSEFLNQLRDRHLPTTIRFHLGAGSQSFLTDSERLDLSKKLPAELARLKVSSEYTDKLRRLIQADELRNGSADGAVTVTSATALHSPHCKHIFQKTHLGLVRTNTSEESDAVFSWILDEMGWQGGLEK